MDPGPSSGMTSSGRPRGHAARQSTWVVLLDRENPDGPTLGHFRILTQPHQVQAKVAHTPHRHPAALHRYELLAIYLIRPRHAVDPGWQRRFEQHVGL